MSKRKGYVVLYGNKDIAHHRVVNGCHNATLPESLSKYVGARYGAELKTLLSDKARSERAAIMNSDVFGFINRRAPARRIVAWMNRVKVHNRSDFKLLEVGEFPRVVKPVKHWDIVRQHRNVDANGKALTKWTAPVLWITGIAVREEARARAGGYTTEWNRDAGEAGLSEQFKFKAVAVYA
jgi:hypothetical protein